LDFLIAELPVSESRHKRNALSETHAWFCDDPNPPLERHNQGFAREIENFESGGRRVFGSVVKLLKGQKAGPEELRGETRPA
jgi:hypothetical protein